MLVSVETQKQLVDKLEQELGILADYFPTDNDKNINIMFSRIEQTLHHLRDSFKDPMTYIKLVDRETGEVVMKYFDKGDISALCYKAAQFYAWADCDDTYKIDEIMCDGRKLEYVGWQPGMLFEFVNEDGDIVYSASFECWDH